MSEEGANIEEGYAKTLSPLPPHKYPIWVIAILILSIGCIVYTIPVIPKMFSAAIHLTKGDRLLAQNDYNNAIKQYLNVIKQYPDSKAAKISFAVCAFSNSSSDDDKMGLSALSGVSLNAAEWKKISKVMPKEYSEYFDTKKR